jgi:hypothetical protein
VLKNEQLYLFANVKRDASFQVDITNYMHLLNWKSLDKTNNDTTRTTLKEIIAKTVMVSSHLMINIDMKYGSYFLFVCCDIGFVWKMERCNDLKRLCFSGMSVIIITTQN